MIPIPTGPQAQEAGEFQDRYDLSVGDGGMVYFTHNGKTAAIYTPPARVVSDSCDAVAEIGPVWTLRWLGSHSMDKVASMHGLSIGDRLVPESAYSALRGDFDRLLATCDHLQSQIALPSYAFPELPKAHGSLNWTDSGEHCLQTGYTADQMREYARAALSTLQSGAEGKDGERYRVIRDAVISGSGPAFELFMEKDTPLTSEAMDALCDAAIDTALQPGQGEG